MIERFTPQLDPSVAASSAPQPVFGQVSRRSLLAGIGLGSLCAMLGLESPLAQAQPRPATAIPVATRKQPRRKPVAAADGSLPQPGPFSLQASCDLSEDYFLTSDVIIGTDDEVVPFINPKNDNAVEAIVFAGGNLSHLYRDPSKTSGWTFQNIDLQGVLLDVDEFAVAANTTDVYLLVFGDPGDIDDNPDGDPAWLTTLDGPSTWDGGVTVSYDDLQWTPSGPVSIKGGIDPSGACYFYTSLVDGNTTYLLGWVASQDGENATLTYQQYKTLDTTNASVEDYLVLFDSNGTNPVGYALVYTSDGSLSVYPEIPYTDQNSDSFDADPLTDAGTSGVTALLWAWATPGSQSGIPGYAVQQSTGTALVDENGNYNQLWDTNSVTQNQATVWLLDGLYTVNMLDSNGAVNMVQETSNSGAGSWASALPLTMIPQGFVSIFSVPTDPSEATLFAVGADTTLSVLTLDTSGWTQTQVHQDGAQLQPIDSYRVQATVLDANGAGVGLASVQVSTDRPVGFWQATGNTTVTPAAEVTMTADGAGQLTFSIPAEELDCAVLTLQALDGNGNPSGSSFPVIPDTDVRTFLNGKGALINVGGLSATTLLAAQNAAGTSLLPTLTGLPADQQTAAATAVATAFNQLITVGNTTAPSGSNTTQAMLIDLSQTTPVQTSTDPNAYSLDTGLTVEFSFSHLFDSIGHAIRHAAMALKKTIVRWADDAKNWVVDLALQIGDDIVNFTDLVVNDMKDAFHVIGGFFHALGADIDDGLEWLKNHVLGFLKDADANATIIQSWFPSFFTSVTNTINTIEIDVDTFFTGLEAQASAQIAALAAAVETAEFGSSAPLPPPTQDTGSHDADLAFKAAGDVVSFMRHSPANWLLGKLRSHLPQAPTDGGPDFSDFDNDLQQVVTDLFGDIADAIDLIEDIFTTLWDAVKPFLTDAGKFTQTSMGDFFTALQATVTDALKLVNQILITVLDAMKAAVAGIQDLLSYQFQAVPVIGPLLELVHIDSTLSIERIVSLIAAYPTTLINTIIGDGPLFPTPNTPPAARAADVSDGAHKAPAALASSRVDGWAVGLNWMSAVVQAVWSFNDLLLDDGAAVTAGGSKYAFKGNALTTALDIICPVVITMLQWPSPTTDAGLTQPFWTGTNNKGDGTDLIPWMQFTAFIPPAAEIFYVIGDALGFADASDYNDYGVPIICSLAGIANTVLSSIYGHNQGVTPLSISFGVLANVSYDVAPLGLPPLNESFEDIPAIAKLIVDAISNFGTSVTMSSQAIAAALKPLTVRIPL